MKLLYFKIQYNIIVQTGRRTYPRYFKLVFAFNRAKYIAQPCVVDPVKIKIQARVIELRSIGWSFPAIASPLDISVGTAWNISKKFKALFAMMTPWLLLQKRIGELYLMSTQLTPFKISG
jgi:hypothetical protein